jgi:hypothetical protein
MCQLLCQLRYSQTFSFHSGIEPVQYEEKLRNSWVWQELKAVRYDHFLHSSSSLGTNYPSNIVMFSHLPSNYPLNIVNFSRLPSVFSFSNYHYEIMAPGWFYFHSVLGIRDILVRIWIRGSVPLTNGSGSGSDIRLFSSVTLGMQFFSYFFKTYPQALYRQS